MYFLIDPIVLCLPNKKATSDEISDFIQHLMDWDKFIKTNQGDAEFCISETCLNSLNRTGRYPFKEAMHELIDNRSDLNFIATDVYLACRRIIESVCWPTFEHKVKLPDLVVYCEEMVLDPNLVSRIPLEEIAESLQETFGYVAYAKEIDKNDIASALYLLTYPVSGSDKIKIGVTVEDEEETQYKVKTDLSIIETPENWFRHKSLTDIWENTEQAIDWVKCKLHIGMGTELSPYTVGPVFSQSLKDCQFSTHSNRLEQCFKKIAQLLAGEQIQDTYVLRTGAGANNPQRTQEVDGETWSAWRLRITGGDGAVYRLHYWKNGNNYVFSNVVNKNDYYICNINGDIVS